MESNFTTVAETYKDFDDAFIEDSDHNSTIRDHSCNLTNDQSMRCSNNSSTTTDTNTAADCQDILHWPVETPNRVNCSEFSSENFCTWEIAGITPKSTNKNCIWEIAGVTPKSTDKNCIWEIAGVTPKSTDKNCIWEIAGVTPKSTDKNCIWEVAGITPKSTNKNCIWEVAGVTPESAHKAVSESAKQAGRMDYTTAAMSPPGLKESPPTISIVPENCSVKVRDILLTYNDSPSKKTCDFSSSMRSLAFGGIVSGNIPQNQPLKSTLGAQNDLMKTDNCCRGEKKGKKLLKATSVKKRAWKEKDVPRKRRCLHPSITNVPPVSLKDSTAGMLLDSKKDLTMDKSFLLTSAAWPNNSPAKSLPLNSSLESDTVNNESWVENRRFFGPDSEKTLLAESTKVVKKWTKNIVPRKRKHLGQLVEETLVLGQPMSENETCVLKFPLPSHETVSPSPVKNMLICNRTIQPDDVSNVVTSSTAQPASDENLQPISYDFAPSNCDADKHSCLWEICSGNKLLSPQNSNSVLANEATLSGNDENVVLAEELKDWEPFATNDYSKTVGATTEDAEMIPQEIAPSSTDTNLERAQLSSDRLKKNRRKSMSADREIVRQMEEMPGSEISDSSDQAFPRNRYPQRLRRRSTELFQFTQIEAFHEAVPNEGSRPESNEPAPDCDISTLDFDFNAYPLPAKPSRRLRRKSTELYRRAQQNQSTALEEMSEQEESTASQKAQNDIVNAESTGKQNGMNKLSRCPKQKKKGNAVEGPSLEDIYLNRLWKSQMPKDVSFETIPEDPKYNKETGGLRFFSVRKAKRFFNFDEGPSPSHLKKRKLKAKENHWKPLTKRRDLALSKLLAQKLSQLDGEIGASE